MLHGFRAVGNGFARVSAWRAQLWTLRVSRPSMLSHQYILILFGGTGMDFYPARKCAAKDDTTSPPRIFRRGRFGLQMYTECRVPYCVRTAPPSHGAAAYDLGGEPSAAGAQAVHGTVASHQAAL